MPDHSRWTERPPPWILSRSLLCEGPLAGPAPRVRAGCPPPTLPQASVLVIVNLGVLVEDRGEAGEGADQGDAGEGDAQVVHYPVALVHASKDLPAGLLLEEGIDALSSLLHPPGVVKQLRSPAPQHVPVPGKLDGVQALLRELPDLLAEVRALAASGLRHDAFARRRCLQQAVLRGCHKGSQVDVVVHAAEGDVCQQQGSHAQSEEDNSRQHVPLLARGSC
mmetsp:Transcript_109329/g.265716  ORF Transcript_109329/g.265716 Transcript_109329/m.265716 type:complete len:222 (+) Transcript_109329:220-885(+)